jgi:hypothetical protein
MRKNSPEKCAFSLALLSGKWTSEEDTKLIDVMKKHGTDWVAIAALVRGRTNNQCRKRWVQGLDPDRASKIRNAGNHEALNSVWYRYDRIAHYMKETSFDEEHAWRHDHSI